MQSFYSNTQRIGLILTFFAIYVKRKSAQKDFFEFFYHYFALYDLFVILTIYE